MAKIQQLEHINTQKKRLKNMYAVMGKLRSFHDVITSQKSAYPSTKVTVVYHRQNPLLKFVKQTGVNSDLENHIKRELELISIDGFVGREDFVRLLQKEGLYDQVLNHYS